MPTLFCEVCNGSGYKGILYNLDKIDDEVYIENIELIKCQANCKNGFIYKVDDESYDTKNSIKP